jgi:hypothetical protein
MKHHTNVHIYAPVPSPQVDQPLATCRERRTIKPPSRFAEAAEYGWLNETDFAKLIIMFTQTLGDNDEIILLSDASDTKSPSVLVSRENSADIKDPKSLEEAMNCQGLNGWDTIRYLLSTAAIRDYEICHLDIKTVFLNGELEEELYLRKPSILGKGYWCLEKGLYGLKQSGCQWYITMNSMYKTISFTRCESEWSVHVCRESLEMNKLITAEVEAPSGHQASCINCSQNKEVLAITATSVDNILLITNSPHESDRVTEQIGGHFKVTDNGEAKWLLGCRIRQWHSRGCLMVDQAQLIDSIVEEFGLGSANPAQTPCNLKTRLTSDMCPKNKDQEQLAKTCSYPTLIGKRMYLSTCTRLNIAYAVRELSRFMGNWGEQHWEAAKHMVWYLKGTKSMVVMYGNIDDPYPLFCSFTDSDPSFLPPYHVCPS